MTIAYRCDGPGCANVLDDEALRIDVQITNEKIEEMATVENDDLAESFAAIKSTISFGWSADTHFCSMTCLSVWAFAKQLEAPAR